MPERSDPTPELQVYPGAFPGSNFFIPDHPASVHWRAEEEVFLRRVLGT